VRISHIAPEALGPGAEALGLQPGPRSTSGGRLPSGPPTGPKAIGPPTPLKRGEGLGAPSAHLAGPNP